MRWIFRRPKLHHSLVCGAAILGLVVPAHGQLGNYTNDVSGKWYTLSDHCQMTPIVKAGGASTPSSPCVTGLSANGFTASSLFKSDQPSLAFSIIPEEGYQVIVSEISFQLARGTSPAGPSKVYMAWSLDGKKWNPSPNFSVESITGCQQTTAVMHWNTENARTSDTIFFRIIPNSATSPEGMCFLRNLKVDGQLLPLPVYGCRDEKACNYNPKTTVENRTCVYPGCMDPMACNYKAGAGCDDGSCGRVGDPCDDGQEGTDHDRYLPDCTCAGNRPKKESPFKKLVVVEVPILEEAKNAMAAAGLDPQKMHCWRVYAQLTDANWELLAMAGGDGQLPPWTLECDGGSFYQDPLGGVTPVLVNSTYYEAYPAVAYDSWFTIQASDQNSALPIQVIEAPAPGNVLTQWNERGGNFIAGPVPYGCVITTSLTYPNPLSKADNQNRILLGQFTASGSISGSFNLLFRRLQKDGRVVMPVTVVQEKAVSFKASGR